MRIQKKIKCPTCGKLFCKYKVDFNCIPTGRPRHYCSEKCKPKPVIPLMDWRINNDVSRAAIGGVSESIAISFMMHGGYFAYHAIGMHGPCDAIFVKDNQTIRAEIRTARRNKKGELLFPKKTVDRKRSDIYIAVVGWDDVIVLDIDNHTPISLLELKAGALSVERKAS